MGEKGARLTGDSEEAAEKLVSNLTEVGGVSSRKMFGGFGVFHDGTMFCIVDSGGRIFFRAGASNQKLFEEADSERHGKMPYYSVPETVLDDQRALRKWAAAAIQASKEAKKK